MQNLESLRRDRNFGAIDGRLAPMQFLDNFLLAYWPLQDDFLDVSGNARHLTHIGIDAPEFVDVVNGNRAFVSKPIIVGEAGTEYGSFAEVGMPVDVNITDYGFTTSNNSRTIALWVYGLKGLDQSLVSSHRIFSLSRSSQFLFPELWADTADHNTYLDIRLHSGLETGSFHRGLFARYRAEVFTPSGYYYYGGYPAAPTAETLYQVVSMGTLNPFNIQGNDDPVLIVVSDYEGLSFIEGSPVDTRVISSTIFYKDFLGNLASLNGFNFATNDGSDTFAQESDLVSSEIISLFQLGYNAEFDGTPSTEGFTTVDVKFSHVGYWAGILTPNQINYLWNNGVPREIGEFIPAPNPFT